MTDKLDKIKKARYKQERLKGNSKAKSYIAAGGAVSTAYHEIADTRLVNSCERELMEEIKAKDITVDWVINKLTSELVAPDAKASDRIRVAELLGKYINMFKEANVGQGLTININDTLDKLRQPEAIDVSSSSTEV